jgi:hypothetical protein
MLEYDEYLLEIQCNSCFLDRLKLGIESYWERSMSEFLSHPRCSAS